MKYTGTDIVITVIITIIFQTAGWTMADGEITGADTDRKEGMTTVTRT